MHGTEFAGTYCVDVRTARALSAPRGGGVGQLGLLTHALVVYGIVMGEQLHDAEHFPRPTIRAVSTSPLVIPGHVILVKNEEDDEVHK